MKQAFSESENKTSSIKQYILTNADKKILKNPQKI